MSKTLDVYLHRSLAGRLTQDGSGQMLFDYGTDWLNNPAAVPLSHSLPLRKEQFKRKECDGFFGGILPESTPREILAKNLGISPGNDFSMLEKIGGECAGAVTLMPAGESLPEHDNLYRDLSRKELAEMLRTLPRRPLLAGEDGVRLSLAGAQEKIAVKVSGDTISIPLNGAPSTHILKPANKDFAGLVFNELLCLNLAREADLSAAQAEARSIEGMDYLLVERYDRKLRATPAGAAFYQRLHQEDFCMALGIPSKNKYQAEGGPSFRQCFDLVREVSLIPVTDLNRLLSAAIFNYLIGNNDAHGKNFSLLYHEKGEAGFAPLYDLVCTIYYPELDKKMAMKIGGEYFSGRVSPRHFEKFAEETGLAKPIVKQRVFELASGVLEALNSMAIKQPVSREVAKIIQERCKQTITGFSSSSS